MPSLLNIVTLGLLEAPIDVLERIERNQNIIKQNNITQQNVEDFNGIKEQPKELKETDYQWSNHQWTKTKSKSKSKRFYEFCSIGFLIKFCLIGFLIICMILGVITAPETSSTPGGHEMTVTVLLIFRVKDAVLAMDENFDTIYIHGNSIGKDKTDGDKLTIYAYEDGIKKYSFLTMRSYCCVPSRQQRKIVECQAKPESDTRTAMRDAMNRYAMNRERLMADEKIEREKKHQEYPKWDIQKEKDQENQKIKQELPKTPEETKFQRLRKSAEEEYNRRGIVDPSTGKRFALAEETLQQKEIEIKKIMIELSGISMEKWWDKRYKFLYAKYVTEFITPEINKSAIITLKNGSKMTGVLVELGESFIKLKLKSRATINLQKQQLSDANRIRYFVNDYASLNANKKILEEKRLSEENPEEIYDALYIEYELAK